MGTQPIGKLLASMAWPAILSMTINALYNIVDSVFVARLGEAALTAVSLAMPIQILIIALAVGSGVGINSLIARKLGGRRFDEANIAAETGLKIAAFNGLIFLLFSVFVTRVFIKSYTSDTAIFEMGVQYLRVVTFFATFSMFQITCEKILQSTGNMKSPMLISMSGAITNLILDPIFIFGLLGFPKLGVRGAAIATICGQCVAMSVGLLFLFKQKQAVKIKLHKRVDWKIVKEIYAVGLPSIIMQSIASVLVLGLNWILSVSTTAIAVLGVYFKLQSFVFMPVFGLNQGAMPIIGYNFGAGNRDRMMEAYKKGAITAFIFMTLGTILFHLIPEVFLGMFSPSPAMLEMGIPALKTISWCFMPASIGVMTATLFQGTGHGIYSLISSLIRQLFMVLPSAYFLSRTYGINATWYAFPLAECFGIVYCVIVLRYVYKKQLANLQPII